MMFELTKENRDEFKKMWVEALRSGKYNKGNNVYIDYDKDGNKCFCTLGVAIDLLNGGNGDTDPNSDVDLGALDAVDDAFKLFGRVATELNYISFFTEITWRNDGKYDNKEHTFEEMADFLEKHL